MEIRPAGGVSGPDPIQPKRKLQPSAGIEGAPPVSGDHVQISEMAQLLSKLQSVPEVRSDRIADVRKQLESGKYETPEKLKATVDQLFNDLVGR